jgi:hypothetical protein
MRDLDWWHKVSASRKPDLIIGDDSDPYLRRWWLIPRNRFFNLYLHQFLRSDYDEALHDHMYINVSYLLEGSYVEHTIAQGGVRYQRRFVAGDLRCRMPSTAHRIEIDAPCWSLFITGPRVREWGFHCPTGWRHWKELIDEKNYGKKVRGCE